jgi:MFS family permease
MHNHRHHVHYASLIFKNKELRDMYAAMSMKTMAFSMVGIFIPIFLMVEKSFTLNQIITFYAINTIVYILSSPLSGKFSSRFGLRKAAVLSVPLFMLFYFWLYNFESLAFNINYLAALLGFAEAVFWIPFITHFIRSSDKKHRSEEVGFLNASTIISAMIGPFIGGVLITVYGFNLLFTVAGIFLFLSIFPLLFTKDYHEPFKCSLKDLTNLTKKGSFKLMAIGSNNISEMVFWPVFLFSAVKIYAEMGLIFFVAELTALGGSFVIGATENREKLGKILRVGALLSAILWFSRTFFVGALVLSLLTVIGALIHEMIEVPYNTLAFDKFVRKKYLSEYVVYRGIMTGIGRLFVLAVISLSASLAPGFWATALVELVHLF